MRILILVILLIPFSALAQPNADKILAKAVSYHDATDQWPKLNALFTFRETRPEGPDRSTIVTLDNAKSYMKINRSDEEIFEIRGEDAKVLKGDKPEERARVLRNYYLYLWGLPMKLYDESTPNILISKDEKVGDKNAKVLRVAYEADVWYFYFDEFSGKLLQYKFYKDESVGAGELITLKGEIQVNGIKIPKERSWYVLPDMKYLGTDILESAE